MSLLKIIFPKKKTPLRRVQKKVLLGGLCYNIKVEQGSRNRSRFDGEEIVFTLKEMTRENFEIYFNGWYRREARKLFKTSISNWLRIFNSEGYTLEEPRLKIYAMRRAWGRCYYTKGLITLNLSLAATPLECIDLITLHELCHFFEHNHSSKFYDLMTRFDNDWQNKDSALKEFAKKYIAF